jgi:membrane associated rhomboid family serine protease
VCGIGAGLVQEVVQYVQYVVDLSNYSQVNIGYAIVPMEEYLNMLTTVGASGAVYGILLGFGMTFPEEKIFIFPLPVPIKAKYFVLIYAVIELLEGLSQFDNVAHFAHLGGMIFGYILIRYWRNKHNRDGYYYQ